MRRSRLWLAVIALLGAVTTGHADGPGGYRPKDRGPVPISEQRAIDAYTAGYASILRAEHAQNLAAASSNEIERTAARRAAQEAYRLSLPHFAEAARLDTSMHEAYTYLGFANRKLGRYSEALHAYEQALKINPDAVHAIEYQAEALLGLSRIDEARFNYWRLYALDQQQAAKLLQAMRAWLAANQAKPPAGIDMPALAAWLADQAASLKVESNPSW
ncbi:MAG: tetratricopeptide repeat protein [Steroidobacteraceae bacterium]